MQADSDYTNHLAAETSPYLLQHAHNPVDWYPWGKQALDRARAENRPILLSIGYSACHWCHVMAHESFEDPATAQLMNELFVNIKVDREERPDLDRIYQTAHSLLTGRPGGWPLTVFLTPQDQLPFFAGTYFPPQPRHGLPAFRDLLQRVAGYLHSHPGEIERQNSALLEALQSGAYPDTPAQLSAWPLDSARQVLEQQFDAQYGGFGAAPKFPHPTSIECLLRHWSRSRAGEREDRRALHMAVFTLEQMARGGIYDQLGGGFCRYSVDAHWTIPHFEKMLYDNGALLALYAQAAAATGNALFRQVCRQTADWVMREMQSPAGGYYSSLDADSEGEEGRYYVWTAEQIHAVLDAESAALCVRHFGLDGQANFEGRWHLTVAQDAAQLAAATGQPEAEIAARLEQARLHLLAARRQRVAPARDDKVLTAWNALMIRGMAIAARHLEQPEWAQSATRALDFIRARLWQDGRLLATCKDGRAHLNAYLDDYVFLIDAILELLQVRWRDGELDLAIALAERVLARFSATDGGFYFTSDDHEALIQRPRPAHDDAMPAGNGVAARVFGRLGHLLGEPRYLQAAEATLQRLWPGIEAAPHGHASLLFALEESLFPGQTVIMRGRDPELAAWQALAARPYAPTRLSLAIPEHAEQLPGLLATRTARAGCVAYACCGAQCSAPLETAPALQAQLEQQQGPLV